MVRASLYRDDGALLDGAHLWSILRLDGFGIVPEINAIDAFVVEPQPSMMRMIHTFTGPLLQWEATSDDGALGSAQRIEDWLR